MTGFMISSAYFTKKITENVRLYHKKVRKLLNTAQISEESDLTLLHTIRKLYSLYIDF